MYNDEVCFWDYKGKIVSLRVDDILYFTSLNRKLYVKTIGKTFRIRATLNYIEQQLQLYHFVRVHQSYLVNMEFISILGIIDLILRNGMKIPISENKHNAAKSKYKEYLLTRENTIKLGKNTTKEGKKI